MRKLFLLVAASVLALGLSAQAGAATLNLTGDSAAGFGIGALPPVLFPVGQTIPIDVSSGAGTFTLPADVIGDLVSLPTQLFTGVPLIAGLTIDLRGHAALDLQTNNPAGPGGAHLVRAGGGLGAQAALDGDAIINVLFLFNLDVPVNIVGVDGGFITAMGSAIDITVYGTGWTTGAVQMLGITTELPNTDTVNTVTFVGFDNRTPGHAGQLQLISPFKVVTNVAGNLPGLATLTLNFVNGEVVPEPGTLLLLGSGVIGLIALGRRRMRK